MAARIGSREHDLFVVAGHIVGSDADSGNELFAAPAGQIDLPQLAVRKEIRPSRHIVQLRPILRKSGPCRGFFGSDLAFAIRASCAVPGVFTPLTDDAGRILVDGGVVEPMPADAAKKMGADFVIAVDLCYKQRQSFFISL